MMLSHHGALDKLKLFHLEDGGFYHQRDYKAVEQKIEDTFCQLSSEPKFAKHFKSNSKNKQLREFTSSSVDIRQFAINVANAINS